MAETVTPAKLQGLAAGFIRRMKDPRLSLEYKKKIQERYNRGRPPELQIDLFKASDNIEDFNPELISGPERNKRKLLSYGNS